MLPKIFEPVSFKELKINEGKRKVLFLDTTFIYEKIFNLLNYNKRTQKISIFDIFPTKENNICGCGCERILEGRKTRWYSKECTNYVYDILNIINGRTNTIKKYLKIYFGWQCSKCESKTNLKIDHIIPVKHGGGGCWLSNYQILCHDCHVIKTNEDFGWKGKK